MATATMQIYKYIEANPAQTATVIAEATGLPRDTVKHLCKRLKKLHAIKATKEEHPRYHWGVNRYSANKREDSQWQPRKYKR